MGQNRREPEGDNEALAGVVHRNIRAMRDVRRRADAHQTPRDRFAGLITRLTGSIWFITVHVVFTILWLSWNTGLIPNSHHFDPYPFTLLAAMASLEALLLTSCVLISQGYLERHVDRRDELDLQVNLLAEHELTRLIELVHGIARKLKVESSDREDVEELKRETNPENVLREIESAQEDQKQN